MIKLIVVGKVKEAFITEGINEYVKRLEAWQKISITEIKESTINDINRNIEIEGENILNKINKDDYVITLEILGKSITSEEFASNISKLFTYGNSNIVFVIGGSWGLSNQVKARSNYALSFSKFTYPHQLMRLILVEQIYRALTIINNKEYHK